MVKDSTQRSEYRYVFVRSLIVQVGEAVHSSFPQCSIPTSRMRPTTSIGATSSPEATSTVCRSTVRLRSPRTGPQRERPTSSVRTAAPCLRPSSTTPRSRPAKLQVNILADLNEQAANEDVALLAALGGSFTLANLASWNTAVTVTTNAATLATSTSATLNGSLTVGTTSTLPKFQYGTSPTLATSTTIAATPSPVTGTATVTALLTGLSPSTVYYFMVTGTTNAGTDTEGVLTGAILSFTTSAAATTTTVAPTTTTTTTVAPTTTTTRRLRPPRRRPTTTVAPTTTTDDDGCADHDRRRRLRRPRRRRRRLRRHDDHDDGCADHDDHDDGCADHDDNDHGCADHDDTTTVAPTTTTTQPLPATTTTNVTDLGTNTSGLAGGGARQSAGRGVVRPQWKWRLRRQ